MPTCCFLQNVRTVSQEEFFKLGDSITSCLKAIIFCSTNGNGGFEDFVLIKLKELQDDLLAKLKSTMEETVEAGDECSLLVKLKRLCEMQLQMSIPIKCFYEVSIRILTEYRHMNSMNSEVCIILSELPVLLRASKYSSANIERLPIVNKFWRTCKEQLIVPDEKEDEDAKNEYFEEMNRAADGIGTAKLVVNRLPKVKLGSLAY
ncbi:hypothetical protein IFM89_011316 [Coptis chinensis]|uniref:Cohesin subunit SCC3/SA HEAT-repeats domain-containing protein n=1 Tax=Coptis chinensis TaxID=261450 RepID=A0A835HTA1_9MAGN|nr:hypothetical protein IFM89_011316 [Coptis chinensis]